MMRNLLFEPIIPDLEGYWYLSNALPPDEKRRACCYIDGSINFLPLKEKCKLLERTRKEMNKKLLDPPFL